MAEPLPLSTEKVTIKSDPSPASTAALDSDSYKAARSSPASTVVGASDSEAVRQVKRKGSTRKKQAQQAGEHQQVLRKHFWEIWRSKTAAPPPPETFDEKGEMPLATCSLWSYATYSWVSPILSLGYQRPLQSTDLWAIDPSRQAALLSANFDASWKRRQREAGEHNDRLDRGEIRPSLALRTKWLFGKGSAAEREREWRAGEGRKNARFYMAIIEQFRVFYGLAVFFKIIGDTCQLMSPILAKQVIIYVQDVQAAQAAGVPGPGAGPGVGMAIGLFLLTITWSLSQHQVWWRACITGALARAALSCSVFKRATILSNTSRAVYSNGKLMNHLSTDISRIDYACMWMPSIPSAVPQIILCTVLLCLQIGPSALAGIAFFALIIPVQSWSMQRSIKVRAASMQFTDERSKALQEILSAMRIIKYFCFEKPYSQRIDDLRAQELRGIRTLLFVRSMNMAVAFSLPVLSAVIAFCCYIGIGNELDPSKIFTALSLFQLLRQPLMLLPTAFSAATDAHNACERLTGLFEAETMDSTLTVDEDQKHAVDIVHAEFEWVALPEEDGKDEGGSAASDPFRITDLNLKIKRGTLCAIVGAVGMGKSSLLQGLIGEMRKVSGTVSFSGPVSYCSQTAWIQNATVRDNVLFGREMDEDKYWRVIEEACLMPDLEMLPDGDHTEIGERGINLSGGQRQRVNIARALYFDAEIVLFDDPLSAVDAHVGKTIFNTAIVDGLRARGKTVILVTHALHLLHDVDDIVTIENGSIAERGTYETLINNDGAFARLMRDFGGADEEKHEVQEDAEEAAIATAPKQDQVEVEVEAKLDDHASKEVDVDEKLGGHGKAEGTGKKEGKLIITEKRNTGAIKGSVVTSYNRAGFGSVLLPGILALIILMQSAQVVGSYWIVWWRADHWNKPSGFYMGIYAAFGISQALFTLSLGIAMSYYSYHASKQLHKQAVARLFYAPSSYFDTVPLGRIMGVFGRDFDTVDNILPESLRNTAMTVANVFGAIILITIFVHYFIIIAVVVLVIYRVYQAYYQHTGREIKRVESGLRSLLYGHFSETLSGLPTVRAYSEQARFLKENERRTDMQNRASLVYITTQRWLAVRLDSFGALLILAVALFVSLGNGVNPSQTGLLLTYTVSLVQMLGMLTRQSAEVENNLNSVERIASYADEGVPQEAAHDRPDTKPAASWPSAGKVEFKNVVMRYRPGLPAVLKGISISIAANSSVGIIGRSGAGKSSLTSAMFRLVELSSGSIEIDGLDIAQLGLTDVRSSLIMIPQDPLLFSGTLRTNLDPFGIYDDARLWSAMKRAHLVGPDAANSIDAVADERFSLDTVVEEEGNNLSVGQRSLVSLARALVREEARIVILDEATAAVDLETDARIQNTIRTELADKTLICIAHRLRTIIFYDRIIVMDEGRVAEFDSPVNLFKNETSIFRQMCERSSISLEEIEKAVASAASP